MTNRLNRGLPRQNPLSPVWPSQRLTSPVALAMVTAMLLGFLATPILRIHLSPAISLCLVILNIRSICPLVGVVDVRAIVCRFHAHNGSPQGWVSAHQVGRLVGL